GIIAGGLVMRSITFRPRTGRIFLVLSAVAVIGSSATGCGWANRKGEKLPVAGSAQRCTGQLFCFGSDSKPKPEAQAAPEYRRPANMGAQTQIGLPQGYPTHGAPQQGYPSPQAPYAQQGYPPQGYAPPGFPPQAGMMPPSAP